MSDDDVDDDDDEGDDEDDDDDDVDIMMLTMMVMMMTMMMAMMTMISFSLIGNLGQHLLQCGVCLLEWYAVCAREPRKMSDGALERLQWLASEIVDRWGRAGGARTMKFHVLGQHLATQMKWSGNLTWSHNYADETENSYWRLIGSSVHRASHDLRFLTKWYLRFFQDLLDTAQQR